MVKYSGNIIEIGVGSTFEVFLNLEGFASVIRDRVLAEEGRHHEHFCGQNGVRNGFLSRAVPGL